MPGRAFGSIDLFIDIKRAAGITRKCGEYAAGLCLNCIAIDQTAGSDCTGIDQRIERGTGLGLQADRIESVTRGFNADFCQHRRFAVLLQCQSIGQRLGHRLDGEVAASIADLVDITIVGGNADAEFICIDIREFGNVISDRAAAEISVTRMQ